MRCGCILAGVFLLAQQFQRASAQELVSEPRPARAETLPLPVRNYLAAFEGRQAEELRELRKVYGDELELEVSVLFYESLPEWRIAGKSGLMLVGLKLGTAPGQGQIPLSRIAI